LQSLGYVRAPAKASGLSTTLFNYEEALARVGLERGQAVLDIGCGAGAFLRLVANRGARPFGLDASDALIKLAQRRVPDAELRVGEMEALPYDDDTFDLVTGFSSFFFANDIVAALREAGRVAKPGAAVVLQVRRDHRAGPGGTKRPGDVAGVAAELVAHVDDGGRYGGPPNRVFSGSRLPGAPIDNERRASFSCPLASPQRLLAVTTCPETGIATPSPSPNCESASRESSRMRR
jgi:SAM-dependent methyltransferase